jgi:hypothetical protein
MRNGTAALLFLCVAGCAAQDFFGLDLLQSTGPNGERMVAGSLESVSQSTQGTLRQLGLSATVREVGGDIRIASQTLGGDRFELVLTAVKTDKGESTHVRVEWENAKDEKLHLQLLSQLDAKNSGDSLSAKK